MAQKRLHFGENRLFFADNLEILRDRSAIPDDSVDLIYLGPPFNSNASYNVLFKERTGEKSAAQLVAFEDTWEWNQQSALARIAPEESFPVPIRRKGPVREEQIDLPIGRAKGA